MGGLPRRATKVGHYLETLSSNFYDVLSLKRRKQTVYICIPAHRMKAGREHRIPLSKSALSLLRRARGRNSGDDWVFEGRDKREPLSNMAMLMQVRRLRSGMTAHGFRSSFRDWAAETTIFSREVVEMALAHTIESTVEAAYRRGDLFEKRRVLMEEWAKYAISACPRLVESL